MKKRDNKLIIIVCVVVILVSLLFLFFKVMKSNFNVDNYINNTKTQNIVFDAKEAVELVSNDVFINDFKKDKYTLEDIDKLKNASTNRTSYYSRKYKKLNVKVIYSDNTQTYSICMIDKNNNGFSYTNIDNLSYRMLLERNNNIKCD